MEKTVKEEGGLLETVHTDLKKVQDDTAMLTRNFEQQKVESGEKIAAVQKQVEDQQKNVTKNTENLSVVDELRKTSEKMIKKVITVEEQFGDDHNETILLKKIVKQQGEDILKMEEELKAERNRTAHLEKRFAEKETKMDKIMADLRSTVSKHEGTINEITDKESALAKEVNQLFELLPNSTFSNGSSVIHTKLEALQKDVAQEQKETSVLRSVVDTVGHVLNDTNTIVGKVEKTLSKAVEEDKRHDQQIKNIREQRQKDLDKYNPEQYGFRYAGSGWSYYASDQIKKDGFSLKECLKFCKTKRDMSTDWNGVNYFQYPSRKVCYCVKGAYGFNPNEHAMRFLV